MPREDALVDSIGFDSYGHVAYHRSTPEEHRYYWRASPPEVSQEIVDRYQSSALAGPCVPIPQLLGVPEALTPIEVACVHLFQANIGALMSLPHTCLPIRCLEQVQKSDNIPSNLLALGWTIVSLSLGPMIYEDNSLIRQPPNSVGDSIWLLPRVCLRMVTHLDDERNLQAVVIDLFDAAMNHPNNVRGVVYGIGFSFFHCVIVRIDTDQQGSFKHTPALQFLPSWYATSQSTPGITALVRLGCVFDIVELLDIPPAPRVLDGHVLSFVPQEIWMLIASYIHSVPDFITLSSLSPLAMDAVKAQPKHPQLGEYRILRAMPSTVPNGNMSDDDSEEGNSKLWEAEFEVAHDGQPRSFTLHVSRADYSRGAGKVMFQKETGPWDYYVWGMQYDVKTPKRFS